mmetsp:Transcript_7621/g.20653  ORF Transcript_7621/g.20653 Transcript_7621/m.20653 type:complete len:108 (-) Transcript_7621:231-554(-)
MMKRMRHPNNSSRSTIRSTIRSTLMRVRRSLLNKERPSQDVTETPLTDDRGNTRAQLKCRRKQKREDAKESCIATVQRAHNVGGRLSAQMMTIAAEAIRRRLLGQKR